MNTHQKEAFLFFMLASGIAWAYTRPVPPQVQAGEQEPIAGQEVCMATDARDNIPFSRRPGRAVAGSSSSATASCLDSDAPVDQRFSASGIRQRSYDFVDLPGGGRVYVAYSTKYTLPSTEPDNNVTMTVVPLAANHVLLFGNGYGRLGECIGSSCPESGVGADMQLIDEIIRICLGYGNSTITFVAPHGHQDHANPWALDRLIQLGHNIDAIHAVTDVVGGGLAMLTSGNMNGEWSALLLGLVTEHARQPNCVLNFSFTSTVLGLDVQFYGRSGHTPGSIDMYLGGKAYVYGSTQSDLCTPGIGPPPNVGPSGAEISWKAHGNVVP